MTLSNNQNITESELRDLHQDLNKWALHCTSYDGELAKDVVQQTYLKVVTGAAIFSNESSLKTWLFGVVRLTCLELGRKQNIHFSETEIDALDEESENATSNVFSIDSHSEREIANAIAELSLMQREIIFLAFYKEITLAEIALILGVSIGTVSTHYHRAKIKLSHLLSDGGLEWKTV